MRYINYYDNDTLSIFDKNTNKILANILLDKEDIPKVQKLHWRLNEKGIVSHLENNLNTDRIQKGKGYCFRKDRNKWMAYIGINYKLKTIGYFNTEKEAKEARKYYCENQ